MATAAVYDGGSKSHRGKSIAAWSKDFKDSVLDIAELGSDIHYTKSAERLRRMLCEKILLHTDLQHEPERFFQGHRELYGFATQIGPGFGIRFTVQYNLFAGTILALGNTKQVASLETMQAAGVLGCFCLTERLAGVNSGLVVNTKCQWDEAKQMFLLHCPHNGATKNWISQGLTADMCVVIADLIVDGTSRGPHGFLMEMRRNGELVPGITVGDMGAKTIGNDLDNAWVHFDKVWLPKESLLDRYGGVEGGAYVQREKGVKTIDMIGQRLYTGRVVIANSTLVFARSLIKQTRGYSDSKQCWDPKGGLPLSEVPQLKALYEESDARLSRIEAFGHAVEKDLCECLRAGRLPSADLVEAAAVLKVKAIETSIDVCFKLKQEVGSYALMGGTGFERLDYLQCCKFAEGDSRILMQKIARDQLQAFAKTQKASSAEAPLCMELGQAMMEGRKNGKQGAVQAWNENWRTVYRLADAAMDRIIDGYVPAARL